MKAENIQLIREAFSSILRADYISISELRQLKELDSYYVDFFNNIPKVLQGQDNFINGRRGTGKTTLLMRAYYECLKTISPSVKEKSLLLTGKSILPIYIDLSQCKDIFDDSNIEIFERNFILKLVEEFRQQLDTIFVESKVKIFKNNFAQLETFDEALELIKEGVLVKKTNIGEIEERLEKSDVQIAAKLSVKDPSASANESDSLSVKTERENEFMKCCSVQSLLGYLGQIRKQSGLDSIYVFIDEFSDLSNEEQARFSILLKKLLGSKNNIYFKVGTITDRYYFGETIIIGRDIYPISLDLCDFVEKYGGIVAATKKLEDYTAALIEKRMNSYAPGVSFSDVFKSDKREIIARISREAMGVPRTIGLILQNALSQAETKKDSFIQLIEINAGIRESKKNLFQTISRCCTEKGDIGLLYGYVE